MKESRSKRVKQFKQFINLVPRLTGEEFIGACKLMGVKLMDGDEPKQFDQLYEELLNKFIAAPQLNRINMILLLETLIGEEL